MHNQDFHEASPDSRADILSPLRKHKPGVDVEPKHLVLLPCSQTKRSDPGYLPAMERYDGPMYKVVRSFLRQFDWPRDLSVGILSARHGLMGSMASIEHYDQRMNSGRAAELLAQTRSALNGWRSGHAKVSILVGHDYLPAIDLGHMREVGLDPSIVEGPVGLKLHQLRGLLHNSASYPRRQAPRPDPQRPLYFLPDWDDMLDAGFDFRQDKFSNSDRSQRSQVHSSKVLAPDPVCDGVVISLAQHFGGNSKGVLRPLAPTDANALSPRSIRGTLGLDPDQILFGDCGAFSYVNETEPSIGCEQALALYELHGFDFGSSVDHLPLPKLDEQERSRRAILTKRNAETFIRLHKERRYGFTPVGVIQGTSPESYAGQLGEYREMGYRHIAVGGLVPMGDAFVVRVAEAIHEMMGALKGWVPWVHFFGIFRPRIHQRLRELGMTSFDSASYFRKAWLRSDQNYLATDGKWYAAIRVPMTSDPRTRQRLGTSGRKMIELCALEADALHALHEYERGLLSIDETLWAVKRYDRLLKRDEGDADAFENAYRRTLLARPWERCECRVCKDLGVDVLIFRGYNRNKRRGVHNTRMLYQTVATQAAAPSHVDYH